MGAPWKWSSFVVALSMAWGGAMSAGGAEVDAPLAPPVDGTGGAAPNEDISEGSEVRDEEDAEQVEEAPGDDGFLSGAERCLQRILPENLSDHFHQDEDIRDQTGVDGEWVRCGRFVAPDGISCAPLHGCAIVQTAPSGMAAEAARAVAFVGTDREQVRAVALFSRYSFPSFEAPRGLTWLKRQAPLAEVDLLETLEYSGRRPWGIPDEEWEEPDHRPLVTKRCALAVDVCERTVSWMCSGDDLSSNEEEGETVLEGPGAEDRSRDSNVPMGRDEVGREWIRFARALSSAPVPSKLLNAEGRFCGSIPASDEARCAPLHWCREIVRPNFDHDQETLWIGTDAEQLEAIDELALPNSRRYLERAEEFRYLLGLHPQVAIPLETRRSTTRTNVEPVPNSSERCVVGPVDPCEKRVVYSCWDETAIVRGTRSAADPVRVHEVILVP